MSNHTPEPWRVGRAGSVVSDTPVPGMGGSDAVEYYGGHLIGESIIEANARRIVACVNACRGLGTDELEQHGLVSLLATQRDELLAALQRLISSDPHVEMFPTSELEICANNEALPPTLREQAASVIQARAVIAMVKGGAENHSPDAAKMVPGGSL